MTDAAPGRRSETLRVDDLSYDDYVRLEMLATARRSVVWACLTEPSQLAGWFGHLQLDARPGGMFEELWRDADGRSKRTAGRVVVFEPDWRLMLSWADDDWDFETMVSIEIRQQGDMARLSLVHSGWGAAPEKDRRGLIDDHITGWSHHLRNLSEYAERMANDD